MQWRRQQQSGPRRDAEPRTRFRSSRYGFYVARECEQISDYAIALEVLCVRYNSSPAEIQLAGLNIKRPVPGGRKFGREHEQLPLSSLLLVLPRCSWAWILRSSLLVLPRCSWTWILRSSLNRNATQPDQVCHNPLLCKRRKAATERCPLPLLQTLLLVEPKLSMS